MGLIGGAVPLDAGDAPCEAPDCVVVTHGLLMRAPVVVIDSGSSVVWRAGGGAHWFVESGSTGGCLSFALSDDAPTERVRFIVDSEQLFAVYPKAGGGFDVVPCTTAFILPNGMAALRYACALHAREGGFGLLLVNPPSGQGPGWDYLA